jgi:hypothetical protein
MKRDPALTLTVMRFAIGMLGHGTASVAGSGGGASTTLSFRRLLGRPFRHRRQRPRAHYYDTFFADHAVVEDDYRRMANRAGSN